MLGKQLKLTQSNVLLCVSAFQRSEICPHSWVVESCSASRDGSPLITTDRLEEVCAAAAYSQQSSSGAVGGSVSPTRSTHCALGMRGGALLSY